MSRLAFPKPKKRLTVKAARDRQEARVKREVRAACVERDGVCRFGKDWPGIIAPERFACWGISEWAHLEDHRRFKTRGRAATLRHTTLGSCILCQKHHAQLDGRSMPRLRVRMLTARGADGPLEWRLAQ